MMKRLLLPGASLLLSLIAVEVALRLIGFSYRLYPERIEFGAPDPRQMRRYLVPDSDLLWVDKNYPQHLTQLIAHPPKILLVGDSCTEYGTYGEALERLIAERSAGAHISVDKIASMGWSSYQGLQLIKRDVSRIKPKIVTIYFGWNDHWIGFGVEDKEVARLDSPLYIVLQRLRVAQLVVKSYIAITGGREKYPMRVPLADFKRNLTTMVEVARLYGITPMLLTAPTSIREGEEPRYLTNRWVLSLQDLAPTHARYADAVRDVATQTSAPLCDLAKEFDGFPRQDLSTKYFVKDGIHLTQSGNATLAGFLYECLARHRLVSTIDSK
jgi:lysophospholipase L1-like esterase